MAEFVYYCTMPEWWTYFEAILKNHQLRFAVDRAYSEPWCDYLTMPTEEQKRAAILSGVALKGVISTPEDVANLALFLASDAARTITGQSINVDAGGVMIG